MVDISENEEVHELLCKVEELGKRVSDCLSFMKPFSEREKFKSFDYLDFITLIAKLEGE